MTSQAQKSIRGLSVLRWVHDSSVLTFTQQPANHWGLSEESNGTPSSSRCQQGYYHDTLYIHLYAPNFTQLGHAMHAKHARARQRRGLMTFFCRDSLLRVLRQYSVSTGFREFTYLLQ